MLNPRHPVPQTSLNQPTDENSVASQDTQTRCDGQTNPLRRSFRRVITAPATMLILAVRAYQLAISPLLGNHCRFVPSCSQYFIESVRKRGAVFGTAQGLRRICRCHPWNPGGYDPP
ncbi:MAG: putative rane protein insertion efficiency factor [Planctomycetota bacterium]|jgi:putative membrane protein insertion efficiency factor